MQCWIFILHGLFWTRPPPSRLNMFLLCYGMPKIAITCQSIPGLDMNACIFKVTWQPMSIIGRRSLLGQLVFYPGYIWSLFSWDLGRPQDSHQYSKVPSTKLSSAVFLCTFLALKNCFLIDWMASWAHLSPQTWQESPNRLKTAKILLRLICTFSLETHSFVL